jgi:hypothetical protein
VDADIWLGPTLLVVVASPMLRIQSPTAKAWIRWPNHITGLWRRAVERTLCIGKRIEPLMRENTTSH